MLTYLGNLDQSVANALMATIGGQYLRLVVLVARTIIPLRFMWSVRRNKNEAQAPSLV